VLLAACTEETNIEQVNIEELVKTTVQSAEKHDVSKLEEFELRRNLLNSY